MRRLAASVLALALGFAAALALVSCGGGEDAKLLPGATAREITENLDRVKQLAGEGECVGAADETQEVSAQVEALEGVDTKLKQALQQGTERLDEAVASCEEETAETLETTSEEPSTEEEEKVPPGQAKKKEKEAEEGKSPKEKETPHGPPATTPPETTPPTPPVETVPPSEGGGTGTPGGVGPGSPVGGGD